MSVISRSLARFTRSQLMRGVAWTLSGTVGARAVGLLGSMVIARVLGREGYGAFGLVTNTSAMFQAFAGLGLGIAVTKFVAEHRGAALPRAGETVANALVIAVATGGIIGVAIGVGAEWIAASTLGAPDLAPELRISAVALPLGAVWGVQVGALVGMQAFRAVAVVNLLSGVATTIATVAGAAWGGLAGAVWGSIVGAAAGGVLAQEVVRQEARRLGIRFVWRNWRVGPALVRFAVPTFLAGAVVTPTTWACSAMLGWQPGGFSELGLLNVATQWFGALLMVPALVSQVILPSLTQSIAAGERNAVRGLVKRAMLTNGALAALAAAVLSTIAPLLIRAYGTQFSSGVPVLILMVLAAALVAVQSPIAQLLAAADRMWWSFGMNVAWAAVTITLTATLLDLGAAGVALARVLAYAIHTVWMIGFARFALAAWEASLTSRASAPAMSTESVTRR